jgi:hypothetical protein
LAKVAENNNKKTLFLKKQKHFAENWPNGLKKHFAESWSNGLKNILLKVGQIRRK